MNKIQFLVSITNRSNYNYYFFNYIGTRSQDRMKEELINHVGTLDFNQSFDIGNPLWRDVFFLSGSPQ